MASITSSSAGPEPMAKASACIHWILAAYLWLITLVPLGGWNAEPGLRLLAEMRAGHTLGASEIGFFVFVTLPAILFGLAVWRRSRWLATSAIVFDLIWLGLQVQSWWITYIFGNAKSWQLAYAKGATTKVLPSFDGHIAPDGMHLLISVLLVAAVGTALLAVRSSYFSRFSFTLGRSCLRHHRQA